VVLSAAHAVRLIETLITTFLREENASLSSACGSMLEKLGGESEHVHLVITQSLHYLDNLLVAKSMEQATSIVSLTGRLLAKGRFLGALMAIKSHGSRLVNAICHLLELGGDAARSACYFVLVKLVAAQDASAVRLGILPSSWERICGDIAQSGNDANSLRTNALALLCFLLQSSTPSLAPWYKIIDALKAVLCSGEQQQRMLACQVLLEAVHLGFGEILLERHVVLHVLDALSCPGDANSMLMKKLMQLVVLLASRFPENLQTCLIPGLARVLDAAKVTIGVPELVGATLELLAALLPLSNSESLLHLAADCAWASVGLVVSDVNSVTAISWLQVANFVLGALRTHGSNEAWLLLCDIAKEVINRLLFAGKEISSQHVALGISLCTIIDDADLTVQLVVSHEVSVRTQPLVCLEVIASILKCSTNVLALGLFHVVLQGAFSARRMLKAESDPVLAAIFDGILSVAKRVLPWWQPRVARVQMCMLGVPEPCTWLDMLDKDEHIFSDPDIVALILGLICSLLISSPSHFSTIEKQRIAAALCDVAMKRPEVASSVIGLEFAVTLCLCEWNGDNDGVSEALGESLVEAGVAFSCSLPASFLAWIFRVQYLDDASSKFLLTLVQENKFHDLLALFSSSETLAVAVSGHLVNLLNSRRSPELLVAVELFVQRDDQKSIISALAAKGAVALLSKTRWAIEEVPWLCRITSCFLRSGALDSSEATLIVFNERSEEALKKSFDEHSLLDWLNAANQILAQWTSLSDRVRIAPKVSTDVFVSSGSAALVVAQLEFAGFLTISWKNSLFEACASLLADPAVSETTAAAALFALRSMLEAAASAPHEDLYRLYLLLEALFVSSAKEMLRICVVKTMAVFFGFLDRLEDKSAAFSFARLPWSSFTWRVAVERFISTPSDGLVPRSSSLLIGTLATRVDDDCRAMLGTHFLDRLVLEWTVNNSSSDDYDLLVLVSRLLELGFEKRVLGVFFSGLAAKTRVCSSESVAVRGRSSQFFQGALVFPHWLWEFDCDTDSRKVLLAHLECNITNQ
jgi:hypothetical protein